MTKSFIVLFHNLNHLLHFFSYTKYPFLSASISLTSKDVLKRMVKAKMCNSFVPGNLPKKIIQKWSSVLASPVQHIFNKITCRAIFPLQWKIEHQKPIPKSYPPSDENDLRNLAPFFSRVSESFVGGWLSSHIKTQDSVD